MRVLVTGSAGFIGSHISDALRARGDVVDGLDILDSPAHDALDFFRTDNTRYDLAIHAAAVIGGREGIDGSPLAVGTNLALDSWYFQWLVRSETPRAVYFSSSASYPVALQGSQRIAWWHDRSGIQRPYITPNSRQLREGEVYLDESEMFVGVPDAVYGWTKLVGEALAARARDAGVDVLVVRPFSGYGETQGLAYPFPSIIARVVAREDPLDIWGDGEQVRDWVNVDDLVGATLAALDAGVEGPVNLCTGRATSFNELVQIACDLAGYSPKIRYRSDKPTGVPYRVGDPAKMLSFYEPVVSLEEGIARALRSR